jgi:type III secretion system YscD/HrpQ family protein
MAAKLVAEEGALKGLVLSLEDRESWVIGRDPDECELVVQDPLTSRKHLIARQTDKGISVENLSLTNPIQINEEEIGDHPRLLQPGDTLKIGNEIFRYYTDDHVQLIDDAQTSLVNNHTADTDPASNRLPIPDSPIPMENENPTRNDTIFDDNVTSFDVLADINFGMTETGRWLIKVIGGPNNGAEFYMQTGHSYVIGTDPHTCDIVFQDTSVSRQHAKIIVTPDETLLIEDLKSRNGVLAGNVPVEGRQALLPNVIVNVGTTSFVVYDREGEMQTIISPLLPSIVKVLQQEENAKNESVKSTISEPTPIPTFELVKPARNFGPLIFGTIVLGLTALAGFGTVSLFKDEPIVTQVQENAIEQINDALAPFPAIRYSYNKSTGGLLLLGHVLNANDKNQLLYNLQGLNFIKPNAIDDSGIVIDEYVWQEFNSILNRSNPAWRGITIHSPAAGQFILSGYLETRRQGEQLNDYVSLNFPYLDLLKKQVVVEEDVTGQIKTWLQDYNLPNIVAKMVSGEITLTGTVSIDSATKLDELLGKVKALPGVRTLNNLVRSETIESGTLNISDHYTVTGQSRLGDHYTVIINGRILSKGDSLDGMLITDITPLSIFLEKDNSKYRIDYNH